MYVFVFSQTADRFFFGWVQCSLLMVHNKIGLPKPLPFFRPSRMEIIKVGRFSVYWGIKHGDFPTGEGLSLPITGSDSPGGFYSLEAMWTMRSITCCCSQIHCQSRKRAC